MMFMTVLKVIFVLLLCVPLVYIVIYFLMRLIDEAVKPEKKNKNKNKKPDRSSRR